MFLVLCTIGICEAQSSIDQKMIEISNQDTFEKQFDSLKNLYAIVLKNDELRLNENKIVDFATNLSFKQEEVINIVGAFYIMDLSYKRLYPFLKSSEAKKNLTYYLSYYLMLVNEDEKAIQLLLDNLDANKLIKNDLQSITLLTKLLISKGDYEKAIEWCDKGLLYANNIKEICLGIQTNKINAYLSLGKYAKVVLLSKTLEDNVAHKEGYGAHFYNNLGWVYLRMKQFSKAKEYFAKGNKRNIDELQRILEGNTNIAITYQEEGDLETSIAILNSNIKIIEDKYRTLNTHDASHIYKTQAKNYYLKKKDYLGDLNIAKAQKMLNYKGSVLKFQGSKVQLFESFADKIFYSNLKDKKFLNTILQADSLIDLMRQEHTEEGSKLFWREKTHTFYENAIETCYRLKDHKKAFYFMEKSRAILLLDGLKDLDARKILSADKQNQEQNLRYKIIGLQKKLENTDETDKNYTKIYQQLINTKEEYNSFIQSLEKTNAAYYQLKYNNQYISLPSLQSALKVSNQSFIEYFVGENTVYAFVATAKDVRMIKINLQEYNSLSKQFLSLTAQKPPHTAGQLKDFCLVANKLYQLIYAPLNIPAGRVIVSHDNYFLPLGALVADAQRQKFLVEDYAFSYSYSANVLFREKEKPKSFNKNLLGFSPIRYNKSLNLNTLSGSDQVLNSIEDKYFSGKVFLEKQATKQNFIQNAPDYKIIQLFTHGKADTVSDKSKIYFYDAALNMSELYQLEKLKAELVVLSACETNLGNNATGEGIMSFARGFAYLGVPSTVSTLWSVNNQSTYQLTESFYQYLDDGYEKDIALQMAQKEYLKRSGYKFPYYWSGVVLMGDSNKMKEFDIIRVLLIFGVIVSLLIFIRKYDIFLMKWGKKSFAKNGLQ
jgi:CHAT domain-containing protein